MEKARDNVVSVQANLLRERQVKAEATQPAAAKTGRRALPDHHDDAGAGGAVHFETALTATYG
jgi:hypothetical protein